MKFEWDNNKAASNLNKHKVSFEDAKTVFNDTLAITFNDPGHSIGESRLLTFGQSHNNTLLVVSHTEKPAGEIRIISARPMTNSERKNIYEG